MNGVPVRLGAESTMREEIGWWSAIGMKSSSPVNYAEGRRR